MYHLHQFCQKSILFGIKVAIARPFFRPIVRLLLYRMPQPSSAPESHSRSFINFPIQTHHHTIVSKSASLYRRNSLLLHSVTTFSFSYSDTQEIGCCIAHLATPDPHLPPLHSMPHAKFASFARSSCATHPIHILYPFVPRQTPYLHLSPFHPTPRLIRVFNFAHSYIARSSTLICISPI